MKLTPPVIAGIVFLIIMAILLGVFWKDITGKSKVTTEENQGPYMIDPASIKISAGKSS